MGKRAIIGLLALGAAAGAYRFRRALLARWLGLPAPQYPVAMECDQPVPMPDGVTLLADRFSPRGDGDFPTILIRTPYGRSGEIGAFGLLQSVAFTIWAGCGYHVVVQGTRGRFRSGGAFDPFVHETDDGRATIDWISRQPWFNGSLGLWGLSYLGYTQWAVAADAPPVVKAMMPVVTSARFSKLFYQGDAFSLDISLRWAYLVQVMEGVDGRLDLPSVWGAIRARQPDGLKPALNHLPLIEADQVAFGAPIPFYRNWLERDDLNDPYWRSIDHNAALGRTNVPTHLIAGWYDIFLREQLVDYATLLAAGRMPYLTVGPYRHSDFALFSESLRQATDWFAGHLNGNRDQIRKRPVRLYVMGAHEWHEMDFWPPPARMTRYFLHAANRLGPEAPAVESPVDRYCYRPADPTPVVGGPLFNTEAGPRDQSRFEARPDVVTYTTRPLEQDRDVIGPVRLELYVRSSRPYTDFVGRLCDVDPNGRSINICDGLFRVAPGKGELQPDGSLRIEIDMWATACRFRRGHRIRLQVASGGHPRWSRNLGVGEPIGTGTRMGDAEQTIFHDRAHPSALVLPIVEVEKPGDSR